MKKKEGNTKPDPKKKGDFSAFQKKKTKKGETLYSKLSKVYPDKMKKFEADAEKFEEKKSGKAVNKPEQKKYKKPEASKPEPPKEILPENTRLNKFVAMSGVCSRRAAADLVKQGEIFVNGKAQPDPSYIVAKGDKITYAGKTLKIEERKVYYLMNKPKNTITSSQDEKGRKTVLDLVAGKIEERVYPVGRLDRNTTGLLLLTNDGDLSTALAHPSSKVKKVYLATLDKNFSLKDLEKLRGGIKLDDGPVEVDDVNYNETRKDELLVTIHMGKNRIVRRIFESLGYEVIKLDRIYFGGLTKKDLPRGFFRPLDEKEVILLKHFIGRKKK